MKMHNLIRTTLQYHTIDDICGKHGTISYASFVLWFIKIGESISWDEAQILAWEIGSIYIPELYNSNIMFNRIRHLKYFTPYGKYFH